MVFSRNSKTIPLSNDRNVDEDGDGDYDQSIHGISDLIGYSSSGISLDGQSLMLPGDNSVAPSYYSHDNYAGNHEAGAPTSALSQVSVSQIAQMNNTSALGASMYDDVDDLDDDDTDLDLEHYGQQYHQPPYENNNRDDDEVSSIASNSIVHLAHLSNNNEYAQKNDSAFQNEISPVRMSASNSKSDSAGRTPSKTGLAPPSDSSNQRNQQRQQAKQKHLCPIWIRRAPGWLKFVLLVSVILLLAAIVLVGVGLYFAMQNKSSSNSSNSISNQGPGIPSLAPSALTNAPTNASGPFLRTMAPTPNTNATVRFLATGGVYPNTLAAKLPTLLPTLPRSLRGEFLINLGDWNDPAVTNCDVSVYKNVASNFSKSTLPVYFIPGANEINGCLNEYIALQNWQNTLVGFETTHWPSQWNISRDVAANRPENFGFLHGNVIFVGLNLPAGHVYDTQAWALRMQDDLAWVRLQFDTYHTQARAMVLFSNASPKDTQNVGFYSPLMNLIASNYAGIHIIIVHQNDAYQLAGLVRGYNGLSNLDVVTVEGSVWPPMKVTIDLSDAKKVVVMGDQTSWYNNYMATGTGF